MSAPDSYDIYYSRVRGLIQRHQAHLTSWWRRPRFTDPQILEQNPDAKPKWHAFSERIVRDPQKKWDVTYIAVCGYEYTFQEAILDVPLLRNEVKTQALRCSRCDRALAKLIAPIDPDTVRLTVDGRNWRIHREDADPEHRMLAYRLAAEWFGNLPA